MNNPTTTLQAPVTLTPSAIAEAKRIYVAENQAPDKFLRVGVKGGGCSGMTYVLEFDNRTEADDLYDFEGLQVVIDKKHLLYLMNMTVDFQAGLNARGFVFQNPNASTTCGCGTSFAV
jgi:iron-sulfur cluster assembly protein